MSGAHRDPAAPPDDFTVDPARPPAPPEGQLSWESTVTAPTEWVPYVYTDAEVQRRAARRGLSTVSLVCGLLGLLLALVGVWGVFLSLAAVVLALVARAEELRARMLWLTGLVSGVAGLLLVAGWVVYITQVLLARP